MPGNDPSIQGPSRKRSREPEPTVHEPVHQEPSKPAPAREKSSASPSDLSSLLRQSGDSEATQYGELVVACNDLSATINQSINKMDKSHSHQATFLRAWLATGVARVLQNRLDDHSAPAASSTAPAHSSLANKPEKPNAHTAQKATYATAAASAVQSEPAHKKQITKASPPRDQGKNDRRVMVRLSDDHPARSADPYTLRLKARAATKHADIVQDVWPVPSGLTIMTPSPAKAAQLLEDAESIRIALAAASVERQESWSTFVVGPIAKTQNKLFESTKVTMEDIRSELAMVEDRMAVTNVSWTKKSEATQLHDGFVRVCVRSHEAHKFPSRLRLFGRPVSVQLIKKKPTVASCSRCFGFHHERNCPRLQRCSNCGEHAHEEKCTKPARCVNCRGPHASTCSDCPARPRVVNGQVTRVKKQQLKSIRSAQGQAFAALHPAEGAPSGDQAAKDKTEQSQEAMETDGEPSSDRTTLPEKQADGDSQPAQPATQTVATENPFATLQEPDQDQDTQS